MEETYLEFEPTAAQNLTQNPWVYRGISRISAAFASVPLILEKRTARGWVAQPRHKLQQLLHQCDPDRSQFSLMERWCMDIHLTGNAYWFWDGQAFGPDNEYSKDGVHWQLSNPDDKALGMSPLEALRGTLELDKKANKTQSRASEGRRTLLLSDKLNAEQIRAVDQSVSEKWDVEKDGPMPTVLTAVTGVQKEELNIAEAKRISRDEIAAALGIPSALLCVESAPKESLEAAEAHLWTTKIVPLLDMFCATLTADFVKRFDLRAGQWRIVPDLSEVEPLARKERALQLDRVSSEAAKAKAEAYERLLGCGMPPAKAAKLSGFEQQSGPSWMFTAIISVLLSVALILLGIHLGVI